jgi:hypothetical protein
MRPQLLSLVAMLLAGTASGATTCDSVKSQIDAKIRASGVTQYTLITVEASSRANGKVVGTCDFGTKKIMYSQGDLPVAPASNGAASGARIAPAPSRNEPILTECRDGTTSVGGDCKK